MKNLLYPFLFLLLANNVQPTEKPFYDQLTANRSINPGEYFTYKVHYGFVSGGLVVMTIDPEIHLVNERPCYKIDVTGESTGLLYLFLKMKNHFGSYLDTETLIPQYFYRNIHEGTYRKNEKVNFDHKKKVVIVEQLDDTGSQVISKDEFSISDNVQDIVSIWYVLRNLDFSKVRAGDILCTPVFFDDVLYENFKTKFLRREVIKTKLGPVKTLVLAPLVPFNSTGKSIFAGENSVELFLSDDENKIPIKIKIKLLIGAVEIDLISCKGLKYALAIKKTKKVN
ncbi:MAG: hypothetical protein BGO68_01695 [Candidatus Amoebophilus sp. 36-38]|nr:MAG: hypothetical protein BGO68_01695 [Candidatus Amoebophilus sp. 36-38]